MTGELAPTDHSCATVFLELAWKLKFVQDFFQYTVSDFRILISCFARWTSGTPRFSTQAANDVAIAALENLIFWNRKAFWTLQVVFHCESVLKN